MKEQNKYYAFISYNSADEKWANWLQHEIEYYHVPSTLCKEHPELPKKIRPIFWYKKDLSGTKLKQALHNELGASKYLIVICSPASAKSDWVNEEVSSFIQQGKEDKIIPFIVNGTPHAANPDEECFPPALQMLSRDEEIRGIDMRRKEGKAHALVDVIATMFGLRFDDLWQRHERRKRQIRNLTIGILAILTLAAIGIYDYTRIKVEYYADYVDRWGVAEGVIPLTDEQVSHRENSYRFEYRRIPFGEPQAYSWRLATVKYINSALIPQDDDEEHSIRQFEYNEETGHVIRINYCNRMGKVVLRHNISEHNGNRAAIADFTAASEEKGAAFLKADNTGFSDGEKMSNIKRFAYQRNADGYIIRKTYHSNNDDDLNSSMIADGNGIFGIEYTLDSLGRNIKETSLNMDGKPTCNKKSIAAIECAYDAYGNISQLQYLDINGKPTIGKHFYSKVVCKADDNGNITTYTYYDTNENVCSNNHGIAQISYKYNSEGNAIEITYYDIDGNICANNAGYASLRFKYDNQGNQTEESYYDVNGKPCYNSKGTAKLTFSYDKNGNITEIAYYDIDGNACTDKDGIALYRFKYDEQGHKIESSFHDVEGNLCYDNDGVAIRRYKYDKQGRQTEYITFGMDNKPCADKNGITKVTRKYDNKGNVIEFAYFDTENNPCNDKDGVAKHTYKYDKQGNITEFAYLNSEGNPCLLEGEAKNIEKYDKRGLVIEATSYGLDGNPCINIYGYSKTTCIYDKLGNAIEFAYFDNEGKPCTDELNAAKINYTYDERGNVIESAYYGTDGKLCYTPYGYAKERIKYDTQGNVIEISWYGTDNKLCMATYTGCAKMTMKYDNRGNRIEQSFYDTKNKLCFNQAGTAITKVKYDRKGNQIEKSVYGPDGKPCLDKSGSHRGTYKYDEKSRMIELCMYNEKNEPTETDGYFKIERIYNIDGSIANTIYYNMQGEIISSQIYALIIYEVSGKAAEENVPVNSIIVKWNNWKIGDGEEKFLLEKEKSEYLPKSITYLTPEGDLKELYTEEIVTGLLFHSHAISKEQADEILERL